MSFDFNVSHIPFRFFGDRLISNDICKNLIIESSSNNIELKSNNRNFIFNNNAIFNYGLVLNDKDLSNIHSITAKTLNSNTLFLNNKERSRDSIEDTESIENGYIRATTIGISGSSNAYFTYIDVSGGDSSFNNSVYIKDILAVNGTTSISNDLIVNGKSFVTLYNAINNYIVNNSQQLVSAKITTNDLSATNISISNDIVVGNTSFINDLTISGQMLNNVLKVPSIFTIDPSGHGNASGTLIINGDLMVYGNNTIIASSNVEISDIAISVATNLNNNNDLIGNSAGLDISNVASLKYNGTLWNFSGGQVSVENKRLALDVSFIEFRSYSESSLNRLNSDIDLSFGQLKNNIDNSYNAIYSRRQIDNSFLLITTFDLSKVAFESSIDNSYVTKLTFDGSFSTLKTYLDASYIIKSTSTNLNIIDSSLILLNNRLDSSYVSNSVFEGSFNNLKNQIDNSFASITITSLNTSSISVETINTKHNSQRFNNISWNQFGLDLSSGLSLSNNNNKTAISNDGKVVAFASSPVLRNASGGVVTISGGYVIHRFDISGTFSSTFNGPVEVLIVGGGGGGGPTLGGGGGGGGVIYMPAVNVVAGTNYSVVVGSGGASGTSGQASSVFGAIAAGGGTSVAILAGSGSSGGSGGGAPASDTAGALPQGGASSGNSLGLNSGFIYGNRGGNIIVMRSGDPTRAAGGGGAGGSGLDASGTILGDTGQTGAGSGGVGIVNPILGPSYYWGGGGGGGAYNLQFGGWGGLGGGGGGAGNAGRGIGGGSALNIGISGDVGANTNGGAGGANTGGGGGGGAWFSGQGGRGGSGIVVIRYLQLQTVSGSLLNLSSWQSDISRGRIYVYELSNNQASSRWNQLGLSSEIIVGASNEDQFGWDLALSSNGRVVAASSIANDASGINSGQVRLFELSNNNRWVKKGSDINGPRVGSESGTSISLAGNGNSIAIGAWKDNSNGTNAGAVRVYDFSASINDWIQKGQTIAGVSGSFEGYSTALSLDGQTLAAGSFSINNINNIANAGQVETYTISGSTWINKGIIQGPDISNSFFGRAIKLSANGNAIVIGAPGTKTSGFVARVTTGWSFSAWMNDTSVGIEPNSNYNVAVNFGGSATTFNNIPFQASTYNGTNFSIVGGGVTENNTNNNINGASKALANNYIFGSNNWTVTLTNLIFGKRYQTTFFSLGNSTTLRNQIFNTGPYISGTPDISATINPNNYGNNNGILIKYTFVANSTGTQVFTINAVTTNSVLVDNYVYNRTETRSDYTANSATQVYVRTDTTQVYDRTDNCNNPIGNWVSKTSPEANTWNSVCWSPQVGRFVAVSTNGSNRVMYSDNGETWNVATASAAYTWYCVCWSPERLRFVAIAIYQTNGIMWSSNGIDWNNGTAPAGEWRRVCWSPQRGRFVAVGKEGSRVMYSDDGINWSSANVSGVSLDSWLGVCWAAEAQGGIFVAVAEEAKVMISSNGINWSQQSNVINAKWWNVAWSPQLGRFVVVGNISPNVMYSTDGSTSNWVQASGTFNCIDVCWAAEANSFVGIDIDGNKMKSSNGVNWAQMTSTTGRFTGAAITWSKERNMFAAVGYNTIMTAMGGGTIIYRPVYSYVYNIYVNQPIDTPTYQSAFHFYAFTNVLLDKSEETRGGAYVYGYVGGTTWTQLGQTLLGISGSNEFGSSVNISNDGTIISVGTNDISSNRGYVNVYKYVNNYWTQISNSLNGNVATFKAGLHALAGDGTTLIQSNNSYYSIYGINKTLALNSPMTTISGNLIVMANMSVNSLDISTNHVYSSNGYSYKMFNSVDATAIMKEYYSDVTSSRHLKVQIRGDGNITNRNNSYRSLSDSRLKENIVTSGPKLEDLLKVRVVDYNMKGSNSTKCIGVLAQELEDHFPNLVTELEPSPKDIQEGRTIKYKAVNYSSFDAILIKSLQEQNAMLKNITRRIEALEDE